MKINFFLPGFPRRPMGGYKIVYQYANYLASQNHDICIYYGCYDASNRKYTLKVKLKNILKKLIINFYPKWFELNKKIRQKCVLKFSDGNVRDADISIATFVLTAEPVYNLSLKKGKKYYFIQDFEAWLSITEKEVIDSYKLDMKKIVISDWLAKKVESNCDDKVVIIKNGINLENFKIINDIEKRDNFSLAMLYHTDERKGLKYGMEALNILHNKYPNLKVNMFGAAETNMPDWISYTQNASEQEVIEILNNSSIFVCTSLSEGFGLPGIESMACGCALVSTKTNGVFEYANEDNSILIDSMDVEQIVSAVEKLFNDVNFRIQLANKGNVDIKKLDINKSYYAFENVLKK